MPVWLVAGYPPLPQPYDQVDWLDYEQWPEKLEINGKVYLIQVVTAGGCLLRDAPLGTRPSLESIQSWGCYSAYYQSQEPLKDDYKYGMYGPYVSWDSNDQVISRRFADGKGAIRSYDKKNSVFHKEWSEINGETRSRSRGYYDRYGRIALEDRTTRSSDGVYSSQVYRYRKPCGENEYMFTKEMLLESFDLYDHAYSVR